MPFDDPTRSELQKVVGKARELLVEEFTSQCQRVYGIQPDGSTLDLAKLDHLPQEEQLRARLLRDRVQHLAAGTTGPKGQAEAVARMLREQSFTVLNRLCALRMCEERGLVQECVRSGNQSKGFRLYDEAASNLGGETYARYRLFLQLLFDELSVDLGVLFDRFALTGLLFPGEDSLHQILTLINTPKLSHIWADDEAIGWVYQYFNSPEERRAMREASPAPRNSRELAVRNQFFTPRYVVEFLTDNTLGRIWYEMRKGYTALKDECRYLMVRPNEVFLRAGAIVPIDADAEANPLSAGLAKRPFYIEHRPQKDPRDIQVLDPACGSGHFLLYAFALLETIYEEGWEGSDNQKCEATGRTLREDYATLDDLRRAAPKLIIEHNLHGIDIDQRAVQIAALALWLRAQKSWKNVRATERPRINRSNIVNAEPMPGEKEMRHEFLAGLKPRVLSQIVEVIFDKMTHAGEAGSLLKIDEEITNAVALARQQWLESPEPEQQLLFPGSRAPRPHQQAFRFDLSGVTDESFWHHAEGRLLNALKEYAELAENGNSITRRLFAEDAARGFAFIDLCRKRYDVLLMNPPFGDPPTIIQPYIASHLEQGRNDIYAALIIRCCQLMLPRRSMLGAITSRAFVVGRDLRDYRAALLDSAGPHLDRVWDLGGGVLDGALVQTCAYVLSWNSRPDFLYLDSRRGDLRPVKRPEHPRTLPWSAEPFKRFRDSPDFQFVFGDAGALLASLEDANRFIDCADVTQGLTTEDDIRFIRSRWEVHPETIGKDWFLLTKGGEYSWYSSDVHLVVNRANEGAELAAFAAQNSGNIARTRQSSKHYFKPAVTYSRRSQKGFSARRLRKGCCFSDKSGVILPRSDSGRWLSVLPILLSSSKYVGLIHAQAKFGSYEVGAIKQLPWPDDTSLDLVPFAMDIFRRVDQLDVNDETSLLFVAPPDDGYSRADVMKDVIARASEFLMALSLTLDDAVANNQLASASQRDRQLSRGSSLVSYAVGCAFGRWDVRIAMDPLLSPKLGDPFDSLPSCAPGMLLAPDGLPAGSGRIVSEEWLRARANTHSACVVLSPETSTIAAREYPIRVAWDGILVDDPGLMSEQPHGEDVVRRVQEVFQLVWSDRAYEMEHAACKSAGFSDLRAYFRKPSGFFEDHLKRYSKSRRKAPIYWPLSVESGSFTIWLYYPRLSDQSLYACVNDYIDPKLSEIDKDLERLRGIGNLDPKRQRGLDDLHELQLELKSMRDELLKIAALPYRPNLSDGVLITAAPLWQFFRHAAWRESLKQCWEDLNEGKYDWAHLAYSIWPDRVRKACKKDKSIAIAHGLEDLYEG